MATSDGGKGRLILWAGLAALFIALTAAWFLLPTKDWIQAFGEWIKDYGAWGVVIFILAYIVAVILLFPAGVLTIAAGLVYGAWAFPLVIAAATTGATLAFLIARHLVRARIEGLIEKRPKFKAVDEAVSEEGWKIVGLLRLSPLVPFNLQNYFFGVTEVGLAAYVAATFVGIIPGTALYVYLGSLGKAAADGAGGGAAQWALLGAGLVATAIVAFVITRKAQQKLKQAGVGGEAR